MLEHLTTETRNQDTINIDAMTAAEIVTAMNKEDKKVAEAVEKVLPEIAEAVSGIAEALRNGGRLIYCGAGTSGRLGVLDAAECVPTFGVPPTKVVGVLAGGLNAMVKSSEGTEDIAEEGVKDMKAIGLSSKDFLVGIAASGRTPYVIGALEYAKSLGAKTCAVSCNKGSEISKYAEIAVEAVTGPEALTGSTRLKAGTAQKIILNMLSTGSMILSGKVYKNLMVDVSPTNGKLVDRAIRIVMEATGESREKSAKALEESNNNPKTAIVMLSCGCTKEEAARRLENCGGFVGKAIAL